MEIEETEKIILMLNILTINLDIYCKYLIPPPFLVRICVNLQFKDSTIKIALLFEFTNIHTIWKSAEYFLQFFRVIIQL